MVEVIISVWKQVVCLKQADQLRSYADNDFNHKIHSSRLSDTAT